jgi:phage-related protein (TIGR01555 family)
MPTITGRALTAAKDAFGTAWAVIRSDDWQNSLTLLGTAQSSLNWHRLTPANLMNEETVLALITDDPMARRIVMEPVDAAFRQGWELSPPADLETETAQEQETAIREKLKSVEAEPVLKHGEYWGRGYGRGCVLLGVNDSGGSMSTELNMEKISELKWLQALKSDEFTVGRLSTDGDKPGMGEPETWLVRRTAGSAQVVVHKSRLILTRGVPTHKEQREENDWKDVSVLQAPYNALRNYDSAVTGLAQMLTDGSQAILKIMDLPGLLADDSTVLRARLRVMEMARALRIMPVNAGGNGTEPESFEFAERTFSGVADTFDRLLGALASAVGWPQTYLFGRSPAGENATGESDREIWDDMVKEGQTDVYQPHLQVLVTLAAYATGATDPEGWTVEFSPLRQETDKERVEREAIIADTDTKYHAMGMDEFILFKHRFGGDEYNAQPLRIAQDDLEAMEALMAMDRERAMNPPPVPPAFAAQQAAPGEPVDEDEDEGEEDE